MCIRDRRVLFLTINTLYEAVNNVIIDSRVQNICPTQRSYYVFPVASTTPFERKSRSFSPKQIYSAFHFLVTTVTLNDGY